MNSDCYDLGLLSAKRPGVITFTHSVAGFSLVHWQGGWQKFDVSVAGHCVESLRVGDKTYQTLIDRGSSRLTAA